MRFVSVGARLRRRSVQRPSLGHRLAAVGVASLVVGLAACSDPPSTGSATESSDPTDGSTAVADASASRRIDATLLIDLESRVEAALERHGVPGAAIAVVEGERVVHARGFGVRQVGRTAPVGADTLFRVADLTRAMTSTMVATLVDENRIEWHTSAVDLGVELGASESGPTVSLRHLLSMTSGLGPAGGLGDGSASDGMVGDRSGFGVDAVSVSDLADRTRTLSAVADLGTHVPDASLFAASSYRAAALGRAGDTSVGSDGPRATFHRLMQERLFGPAGMTRTVVGVVLEAVAEDHATPHAPSLDGRVVGIEGVDRGAMAPADGVASTAGDLGRFLVLHLRGGIAESGQRVASAANLAATHGALASADAATAALWSVGEECSIAMGWTVCRLAVPDDNDDTEDGAASVPEPILGQLGGVDGFSAVMVLVPRLGVGLAVVANLDPRFGGLDFVTEVRDHFLRQVTGRASDDSAAAPRHHDALRRQIERLAASARPVRPAEAQAMLGSYEGGWSVARVDDGLELRRLLRSYPLQVLGSGRFVVSEGPAIGARVQVEAGSRGLDLVLIDPAGRRVARVAKLY